MGPILVRRFAAEPRDEDTRQRLAGLVRQGLALDPRQEAALFRNGVWSEALRQAIQAGRNSRLFLFAPLEASTTIYGVDAAPQQSALWMGMSGSPLRRARLVRRAIETCHRLLFDSEAERAAAEQEFDLGCKVVLSGRGVDYAESAPPLGDARTALPAKPYAVCIGALGSNWRGSPLMEYARRLAADSPLPLAIALAGPGDSRVPPELAATVVHLGAIGEDAKWALLREAVCFIVPEGEAARLDLAMEAWLCGRPWAVERRNGTLAALARAAGGGLAYGSYEEFRCVMETLVREPDLADAIGAQGGRFARLLHRWEIAIERHLRFFREMESWLDEAELG
ncbi:MAG: hypothetical protein BWZ10_01704 [candidate division BRC1 bacterium ADurb.BinA364]|nr:MAG: hypothetical protein BWZ10_01704 [candidate division BRC1 bacterium ADurb.BinA364]